MICIILFTSSLRPIRSISLLSRRNSGSWALLQSALNARPPRSLSLTPSRSPLLIICVAAASASEGTTTASVSNVGDSLLNPQFKPCFHIGALQHEPAKLVDAGSLDDLYPLLSSLLFSFDLLNPVRTQRAIDHSSSNPSLFLRMTLPLSSSISSVAGVAARYLAYSLSEIETASLLRPPMLPNQLARDPSTET